MAGWTLHAAPVPDSEPLVPRDRPVPLHGLAILDQLNHHDRLGKTPPDILSQLEGCKSLPTRLDWLDCVALAGSYLAWTIVALILSLFPLLVFLPTFARIIVEPEQWLFFRSLWLGALGAVVAFFLVEGMIVPGGLIARSFGIALVGRDGRPANWVRGGLRELLGWIPLILVAYLIALNFHNFRKFPESFLKETRLILLYPILATLHSLFYPGRLLHDRLAGTYRVIK